MVTTNELAGDRNDLVLSIAKEFGEKLGMEQLVQDACTDMLTGIRISQVVLSFSEGLRLSVPLTGKVFDRGDLQEMQDVPGDEEANCVTGASRRAGSPRRRADGGMADAPA